MFIYTDQLKDAAAEKSAQDLQTHQCQVVSVVHRPMVCSIDSPREHTSITVWLALPDLENILRYSSDSWVVFWVLVLNVHPQDNRPFMCVWEELSSQKHITKFILQWACRLYRSNMLHFRYMVTIIMALVVLGQDSGSQSLLPLIQDNVGWKAVPLQATKKVVCYKCLSSRLHRVNPWFRSILRERTTENIETN